MEIMTSIDSLQKMIELFTHSHDFLFTIFYQRIN